MKTECSCADCQSACTRKPGWLLPEDLEPISKFLNLTVKELFDQYLQVDWMEEDDVFDHDVFVLSPAIVDEEPGTMFPSDPAGQCVFYKEGLCAIHEVKPFECREAHHSEDYHINLERHQRVTPVAWLDKQDLVEELLGEKPVAAPYYGGGILSRFWS